MKKELTISPVKHYNNCFGIYTCNPWFEGKEEIIFTHDEYGVSFRVVGIDDDIDTVSVYAGEYESYRLNLQYVDLHQHGRLTFDHDDSTEDQILFQLHLNTRL